jgi:hypothetical protein
MGRKSLKYKEIPQSSGYMATTDGCIIGRRGEVMKPWVDRYGYSNHCLLVEGGKRKDRRFRTHRLIAEAFHGPPEAGQVCMHLNGNKLDNRPENLKWGTQSENKAHELAHGTKRSNERHWKAKLTDAQVIVIKQRLVAGLRPLDIAAEFGVDRGPVDQIKAGRQWRSIPWPEGFTGFVMQKPKLNEVAVKVIKCCLALGRTPAALGRAYRVSESSIRDIRDGRSYGCVGVS